MTQQKFNTRPAAKIIKTRVASTVVKTAAASKGLASKRENMKPFPKC